MIPRYFCWETVLENNYPQLEKKAARGNSVRIRQIVLMEGWDCAWVSWGGQRDTKPMQTPSLHQHEGMTEKPFILHFLSYLKTRQHCNINYVTEKETIAQTLFNCICLSSCFFHLCFPHPPQNPNIIFTWSIIIRIHWKGKRLLCFSFFF